jgi:hypothetical protein
MSTHTTYYTVPRGYSIIKEYYIGNDRAVKEKQRELREQYFDSKIKIHRRNGSIFIIKEKDIW